MTDTCLPALAAADWGTSRLRVWLLDRKGFPLAEQRTEEGMSTAREIGFAVILERVLRSLGAPENLPVIVCGMAGSKQGWLEAPYVYTPAAISEVLGHAVAVPGIDRKVRIVPGLAQKTPEAPDVMRGEETQLAGGASHFAPGAQLVCMPGTHSKWVEVEDGMVKGFSTWLTGELYALLSSSSILRHTIGADADVSATEPAFGHWVKEALANPQDLTRRLFGFRAAGLLHGMSSTTAAAALSGLLIGTELASARPWERLAGKNVVLIASGKLRELYGGALRLAGCDLTVVDADEAVRAGLFAAAQRVGLVGTEVEA